MHSSSGATHPTIAYVGRNGDQQRRDAHQQQRGDERRLAAEAVAEMPERDRADRPGDEREAEAHEAEHLLRRRCSRREEQRPEHQRGGGRVDVEVVELDRGADQRRGQHAAMRAQR
jgi:hypothetical protein